MLEKGGHTFIEVRWSGRVSNFAKFGRGRPKLRLCDPRSLPLPKVTVVLYRVDKQRTASVPYPCCESVVSDKGGGATFPTSIPATQLEFVCPGHNSIAGKNYPLIRGREPDS